MECERSLKGRMDGVHEQQPWTTTKKNAKLFRYFWAKQQKKKRYKTLWGLWTALNGDSGGHTECSTKLLSTILCYGITERRTHSLCVRHSYALCKYTPLASCHPVWMRGHEAGTSLRRVHATLRLLAVCNIYSYFVYVSYEKPLW